MPLNQRLKLNLNVLHEHVNESETTDSIFRSPEVRDNPDLSDQSSLYNDATRLISSTLGTGITVQKLNLNSMDAISEEEPAEDNKKIDETIAG